MGYIESFGIPAQAPHSGLSGISEDYENESYIWGTNIRQSQIMRDLERFFQTFAEAGSDDAKYLRLLREVRVRCGGCKTAAWARRG